MGLPEGLYFTISSIVFIFLSSTEAYDALDPNGNITIKWDVINWTSDGYVAAVKISNFQSYRHIEAPGWKLGWTWAKKEIIKSVVGGQATDQGDCSTVEGSIAHSCKKSPTIVDFMPGTPYNQQIANCCRGGVLSSEFQDPANSISTFQISVGQSANNNKTVRVPRNFTLMAPGPGYTCGPAKIGRQSQLISKDGRNKTLALMTWTVTCTYSMFLTQKAPTCCVSLSSFYNDSSVSCPSCSCGCQYNATLSESCGQASSLVQCTSHMCPVQVNWHVKANYKDYWRVEVTVINLNYSKNYSQWNLVVQHPDLDSLTEIPGFNYKPLSTYSDINDTAMLWGIRFYNDLLIQNGSAQSEILFRKDKSTSISEKGWAFPRRIYFNGDNCLMPPPDSYPWLPNTASRPELTLLTITWTLISTFGILIHSCLRVETSHSSS